MKRLILPAGEQVTNLPRVELMNAAKRVAAEVPGSVIYFKVTCSHCRQRITFAEPGKLYETVECCECGKITEVTEGGMLMQIPTR